jgi:predicted kinase
VNDPRIILLTGAPGSGKSTLGSELARALQVPFLARDTVRRALFLTNGAWTAQPGQVPTRDEATETFLRLLETMTSLGVSCVAEYVVRAERPDHLARITAAGDCVVVLTECRDPLDRVVRRDRSDRLLNRRPVLDTLGYASIEDHSTASLARMRRVAEQMRTDFGPLPTLTVRTDDGYDPALDAVVEFVTRRAPEGRRA